jgi:archaellum component FlaC
MSEQQSTFFSRLGSWFRKSDEMNTTTGEPANGAGGDGVSGDGVGGGAVAGTQTTPLLSKVQRAGNAQPQAIEPRGWFFRPGARRDAAITRLQEGFGNLSDLMSSIRDNLERQSERQDELLKYLSSLPTALESLPESNRLHGETLKAIHEQIGNQAAHQEKLGVILEKLHDSGAESKTVLDDLASRVETMRQTDEAIAGNLNQVGSAMETVSKHSATSAQVLEQLREKMAQRDEELQRLLQKQNQRFMILMVVCVLLAIAALVAALDLKQFLPH